MFVFLFFLLVRVVVVPWGTYFMLSETTQIADQLLLLGVAGVYTILTVPMIAWQVIKFVPNLALIRMKRSFRLLISICIEILAGLAIWAIYAVTYS